MPAANRFDLATLASHQVAELGARLRRIAEGESATSGQIGGRMVELLEDALRGSDGRPALALARAYRTAPLSALSPELQAAARAAERDNDLDGRTRCLVLVASRGREPAWNDVARSAAHRAIPLASGAARDRAPHIAALVARLDAASESEPAELGAGIFHVPDAAGSPDVPAQRDFVERHGIRSVVGCAALLPDGELFVLVLFSTVPIDAGVARSFEILALHARIALLDASDARWPDASAVLRLRTATLERLLRLQEYEAIRHAALLDADLGAERRRAEELGRRRLEELRANTDRLERTQRAMLNVIDDLRAARQLLERRVGERTAELERANAALTKSNRDLEEFAYVASHDLQEPLRTIVGYLQLIDHRYRAELNAEAREFIGFAVGGAGRMQALIDGLLSYSRVTSKERAFDRVSLGEVLDDALAALAAAVEESGARIERDELPEVVGDRLQLGQLLQNLLSNALKFAGGAPPRIEVRCARRDRRWEIAVRDHGIGFDPRHKDSVFRVFRRLQRKYAGTGVGLAIAKKVVERHGGEIRADAAVGAGATFTFTLPIAEDNP